MAVQTITYDDKTALDIQPDIADVNKVTDNDMNEIKSVVNNNANEMQLNFCLMNTSANTINITSSQIITSWENAINYGNYTADTTNSRLTITNTTLVEVSGATAGNGSATLEFLVTDSNGNSITGLSGVTLENYGDVYWAAPMKSVIYELDTTKTYYVQLRANVYTPSTTFSMNNGFNKKSTWISARKIL